MKIGEVIRKYRKERNLTQEEMACALGVTAPAVNKWENGNSLPDILLLAPIARLLGITLDTLLCFQETLTEEEYKRCLLELEQRLKTQPYEEVFQWTGQKLQQYPNCEKLFVNMAARLEGWRIVKAIPDNAQYEEKIAGYYTRGLDSSDEVLRCHAAEQLFNLYLRKEDYEKAREYLSCFSSQNPEKMRKQAMLYAREGRREEAYKAYEELLFSEYQMINSNLHGIYSLATEEEDREKARIILKKQIELARLFEMGEYYEYMWRLDLATLERDEDAVVEAMEKLLQSCHELGRYNDSPLFAHMAFGKVSEEFYTELRKNLLKCFRDEDTCGWLKDNPRWRNLK